ncbi:metallophosphoesterase family protein [Cupriavidus necator]
MPESHVFICGDPHGEFGPLIESVHRHRPEAVVLAGDIQARRPLDEELASILPLTQVWWIPGNHDTDSDADYDNLFGSALADRNLDGRVVTIAGVRIAGLGGIFRGQIWMPPEAPRVVSEADYLAKCGKGNYWRGGLPRRHRSTIFPQTYNALLSERADVLVSHEAPACHPHGFDMIDTLIDAMGVQRAFHGHHHESTAYPTTGPCRIFGLGACAVATIDGEFLPSVLTCPDQDEGG